MSENELSASVMNSLGVLQPLLHLCQARLFSMRCAAAILIAAIMVFSCKLPVLGKVFLDHLTLT